jgi:CBS domain-containing protein
MEEKSPEREIRRRSLRIVMRVPLYVCPADSPATAEWEPVETLVISLHGGMIRSRRPYPIGTKLDIRMRNKQRSTHGRVVWTSTGARDVPFEIGFEILDPPGFWDIKFPADRRAEGKPPLSTGIALVAEPSRLPKDKPKFVGDIMTADLITLNGDAPLSEAMLIFSRGSVRHIPIVNGKQLVGILTERDLKHYTPSILSGISSEQYNRLTDTTPVSKVMSHAPLTIEPGKSLYEAAQMLYDRRIECLPVVEGGELKGIVTVTDMLNLLLRFLAEKGLAPPGLGT